MPPRFSLQQSARALRILPTMKTPSLILVVLSLAIPALADHHEKKPPANSNERTRPEVITPGTSSTNAQPGKPPSDAIILFDGKNLANFTHNKSEPAKWKVEHGYAEVNRSGPIQSKQSFGDAQLHIEWATPSEVKGKGQGRGNSGVFLGGYCEVQVLDSFENDTYPGGQASALYSKTPPLINASRKPGVWQSYDIIFHLAKGEHPAHLTVLHNGVVVHHAYPLGKGTKKWNLRLQDHGNPVRYRNIWVRELKDYR
jgi:hypothetical protein